jgi:hypothetical protein
MLERGRIVARDHWPELRTHSKVVELFGEGETSP